MDKCVFRVGSLLTSLVLFAGTVTRADDTSAASKFVMLYSQWKDLDEKIDGLVAEFREANEERQKELRKQFEEYSVQAKKMRPSLRTAAIAAYKESPNEDKDVSGVLLGLADMEIHRDNYAPALEITSLLVKHKCKEEALNNLAGMAAFCTHDFDAARKYFQSAKENDALDRQGSLYLSKIDDYKKLWADEKDRRAKEAKAANLPRVKFETSKGDIVLELFENEAPKAVGNFVHLVEKKFYDGLTFHRVLPGFMAQGGCPNGTGTGGPGYKIPCECYGDDIRTHFAGSLSMAHAGRDTGGSQFFLTFRPTPHLDGRHTVFGRVVEGLDVLAKLQRIDPGRRVPGIEPDKISRATVLRKRDHEYKPTKVE